jgi:hypothetical protein
MRKAFIKLTVLASLFIACFTLSSCNSDKRQFQVMEPVWKSAADSVFKTHSFIVSRRNYASGRLREMIMNHIYTEYLDSTVQLYLDSLQALEQKELTIQEVMKGTFERVLKGTEKHDLKVTKARTALQKGLEPKNLSKFIDTTFIYADSLKKLCANYKLSVFQSHSMTSNLYHSYKSRMDQEIADFNARAKAKHEEK